MKKIAGFLRILAEKLMSRFGLGMRAKLIVIFLLIKVIPLVLLTYIAWRQFGALGADLSLRMGELTSIMNSVLSQTGEISVRNSVEALNDRATDDIERMTTDLASQVADFLYERDNDIRFLATLPPTPENYRRFVESRRGRLIKKGRWALAPDGKSWVPIESAPSGKTVESSNRENDRRFRYRQPDVFDYEYMPLYLEASFVDLEGNEVIKAVTSPRMDSELRNVSDRRNTFVKAETYFEEMKDLPPWGIYVSDVIGAYVPSRFIGMYTPENLAARGLDFKPEEEAYAGMENPNGRRFEGLVRWATPVFENGEKIGYATLALNHDHIMEFTDHLVPTKERYAELPSAYEGNYAFIWDYKCRSICHPRHHSITGFDPETGEPQVAWLEESIYEAWQKSGRSYVDFIKDQPTFVEQSVNKKPAPELTAAGLVGLDGRYLNFAPQCTGWFDLTSEGGSGSFVILWSGLTKLTTAAAIPYYTGHYGESKRGFGIVTIGAGLDYFQSPAMETKEELDILISDANSHLSSAEKENQEAISKNLADTATQLITSAGIMIVFVVLIAIWMASVFTNSITKLINGISRFHAGERQFRFNAPVKDELGTLADAFDEMADSIEESAGNLLCITDMDQRIIYMNEMALAARGTTLADSVGTLYGENSVYPPGSQYCPITALLEGREASVYYQENTKRYLKGAARYLTDKNGKKIGYVITTTDVTAMASQQKKTEEQKALLDIIFSSSPDLIWYEDPDGLFLAVNPRFSSVAGLVPEEVVGRKADDILPEGVAVAFRQNDEECKMTDGALYTEEKLVFADGHEETLDSVRTAIRDAEGNLRGLLGVARDVSVRVIIESELRKTQLELESAVLDANRANEHKSDFLARMSHEIRTPMNAIIGMTNIVKRKLGEGRGVDEIQPHVRQIEASSRHLLGLLNDILDISKIEAGKIELSEEPVDLRRLAVTVGGIIKPRCDEKSITFGTFFDTIPQTTFISDSLRLSQVLINLLGNAVKFTPEYGRVDFRMECLERRDGKALISFTASDTGIGISEAAMPRLFQEFEQGGGNISRQYGGTGLGLAISKRIVQLLGGDISVKSKEGEGSDFSFEIWLRESDESLADDETTADPSGKLTGMKALLVDDVPINRIIAMDILESAGMSVDEAEDGIAALKAFENSPENTYDIIFMDVQMPGMDGYETASAIRALERSDAGSVPIVAITANAFKEDIDKALAHGMNAHVAKPLEAEKLMEVTLRFLVKS
jgi:PAS domain S-box-containing protein